MERGVIVTPDYEILNNGQGMQINGSVNPTNLRHYLLFWDKIDYPVNNMIHYQGGEDIDFLIQEGVAQSSEIRFREIKGDQSGFIFLSAQMAAYEANSKAEDQEWSIAQPTSQLVVPKEFAQTQGCLEFELYNAIQIPTGEVPLSEVFEFKIRRAPELESLREAMDGIVDSIVSSQNIPKRKNKALSRLHRDLNDFNKVMKETKFERIKRSLTTIATDPYFSVVNAGVLGNSYLPENYQPYVQTLNVAALGACAAKFTYKELSVGRSIPDKYKHFAYLSAIKQEIV
ncbi:DUF6236 family protein [Vibrio owensii]|uniref:DUF6236 family protein n=1 Tax=Vibrio owensii TaxID=696485 RepID=UPI003CE58471